MRLVEYNGVPRVRGWLGGHPMAIVNYLDPMDRFSQGNVLSMVGDAETAGGICRMLSIYWVIECLKPGAGTPSESLHKMKSYGPFYFKQIAQAQKAYAANFNGALLGWFGSVRQCLKYGSGQTQDMIVTSFAEQYATTASKLADRIAWATETSTTTPPACLISFSCSAGNHCIAGIETSDMMGSTWHVFDPNYGVMIVEIGAGESLGNLISDLWTAYTISGASVGPVA
jgi:hypothetical protein